MYLQGVALLWLVLEFQQSLSAGCRRKCEGLAGWDSLLTMSVRQTHPMLYSEVLKRVMDPRAAISNSQQKTKLKEILIQGGNPSNLLILVTVHVTPVPWTQQPRNLYAILCEKQYKTVITEVRTTVFCTIPDHNHGLIMKLSASDTYT